MANAQKVIADKEAKKEKPTKGHLKAVVTAQTALDKLTNEKNNKITAAHEQAEKECQAIDELLKVLN